MLFYCSPFGGNKVGRTDGQLAVICVCIHLSVFYNFCVYTCTANITLAVCILHGNDVQSVRTKWRFASSREADLESGAHSCTTGSLLKSSCDCLREVTANITRALDVDVGRK